MSNQADRFPGDSECLARDVDDAPRPADEKKAHWLPVHLSLPRDRHERLTRYAARCGRPLVEVVRAWLFPIIDSLPDEREAA